LICEINVNMIYKLLLTSFALFILNCDQPNGNIGCGLRKNETPQDLKDKLLFTHQQAVRILGEPAHMKDSSSQNSGGISRQSCSFFAITMDSISGKTGAIYFMIEEYNDIARAKDTYESIRKSNEGHEGIKTLNGLGDEAYFHSDNSNFYFILVRKREKVIRMKVNKITSHTSLDAFHSVAREITTAM